jgi:hypothetical protein
MVGKLTQGGTSGSCRWSRPGLPSDAPLGLYNEEAASCRFTNVQSPGDGCESIHRLKFLLSYPRFSSQSKVSESFPARSCGRGRRIEDPLLLFP